MTRLTTKPSVLVTVPNQSWVHRHVAATLLALTRDDRANLAFSFPSERPYENNLNGCVQHVLDHGFDWWLTMDDDNPPPSNVLDLIEFDKDVIGCPTPVYRPGHNPPLYWNALDEGEKLGEFKQHKPCEGLQQVDVVGSGCMLVKRRVLEVLPHPFERIWNKGRVVAGPDITFCRKVWDKGFEVWAHYDYPCRHYTEVDLKEVADGVADRVLSKELAK